MRRRPLLRDHLLLLSAISALILFLCGPNELSAQTVNINTNWTRGQIRSAFTNATAGSTIKFAAGNYDVNRLRVGADGIAKRSSMENTATVDSAVAKLSS